MKHRYYSFLTLFWLGICFSATAQHKTVVYGNLGVSNVNVSIVNTRNGTSSDARGNYTLPLYNRLKTVRLHYSCIGFHDTIVSLSTSQLQHDSINISFKMCPKNYDLQEVTIMGNKPEIAYHEKLVSLVTYEINEMGIYLIGYQRRGNALLHLSFDLDTLSVLPIAKKYDRLYKDVFGQIHLMSHDSTYQIGHRQLGNTFLDMELFYGMAIDDFYYIMGDNAAVTDSVFVIATYCQGGQELYYHYFKRGNPNGNLLEHVFNQEGVDLFENILEFGADGIIQTFAPSSSHYVNFIMRPDFRSWTLIPPIYDPLFSAGNALFLFDFDADKIEYFDKNAQIIGETPIKFHRYLKWNGKRPMKDSWKKQVLVDTAKKEFYAVFEKEGLMNICKIDLKTGQAKSTATLSGFQFVQLPMVHDGMLYFMYHTGPTHSKALYRMRLD